MTLRAVAGGQGGGGGSGTVTQVQGTGSVQGLTLTGNVTVAGALTLGGSLSPISLISQVTGLLPVANGGTGVSTLAGLLYGNGTSAMSAATGAQVVAVIGANAVTNSNYANDVSFGTANQILYQVGPSSTDYITAPTVDGTVLSWTSGGGFAWVASGGGSGTVTSVAASGGTTGLSFTGSPITSSGTLTLGGTLSVANGGTGVATLTGIVKGNGTGAFSAANGTDITSVIGLNAVTNATNATAIIGGNPNQILYQSATGVTGTIAAPTVASTFLQWNGTGFVWATASGSSSLTIGTTTIASGTSTYILYNNAGVLGNIQYVPVANGGTGVGTLTGLVYGNGTSAMTAATSAQIATALGAATFNNLITFNGSTSVFAQSVLNATETVSITGTAATGALTYSMNAGSIQYYNLNATANFTLNVRFSSSTTLNTALAVGASTTLTLMVNNGATPYYLTAFSIDGTVVAPYWQGGAVPSTGYANGIDVYNFVIVKTAASTYTVLASQTQF